MKSLKLISLLGVFLILVGAGCSRPHRYWKSGDDDRKTDRLARQAASLIEKTVQDRDRADRVKALVAELIEAGTESYQHNRYYRRQFQVLNAKYDATPEEFGSVLNEIQTNLNKTAAKIVELRFKIKEQLKEEEWKVLSKYFDRHGERHWAN